MSCPLADGFALSAWGLIQRVVRKGSSGSPWEFGNTHLLLTWSFRLRR